MEIIQSFKTLEDIVAKHNDLVGSEAKRLCADYAIDPYGDIEKNIEKLKQEDRLLKVGIVGRVKAGKSSLLNALFFDGKSILPKAATPMTAALSVLKYGEKLSAKVDFFTQKDISAIKDNAKAYKKMIDEKVQEAREKHKGEKPFNEELKRKNAINEFKNSHSGLHAAYEQEEKLKNVNVDKESEIIKLDSISDLDGKLYDYVGANGKYTHLTKSTEITFPNESLKDIEVVDTPGINDPVMSREQRTQALLKECDVVFVVSPAGQFISAKDLEFIDRIKEKEGINEIFLIASQMDNQLHGDALEKSDGNLYEACDNIMDEQKRHVKDVLGDKGNKYEKLLKSLRSDEEVLSFTSGVCFSIEKKIDSGEDLDENEKLALDNLKENYPDYFSEHDESTLRENLKRLANIEKIKSLMEKVKDKKESIIEDKIQQYIQKKQDNLLIYVKELNTYIQKREDEIHNADIDELKKEQEKLKEIKVTASGDIDELYGDLVDELDLNLSRECDEIVTKEYKRAKDGIRNTESSEEKSYEKSTSKWYNPFSWGDTETVHYTVHKIDTEIAYDTISDFTDNLESKIKYNSIEIVKQWKNTVRKDITETLRDNMDDEDINLSKLKSIIRTTMSNISYPELSYSGGIPEELSPCGVVEDSSAQSYKSDAMSYISELKKRVKSDVANYASGLCKGLKKFNFSKEFFDEYDNDIANLQNQIENKQATLDGFERLKKSLSEVL